MKKLLILIAALSLTLGNVYAAEKTKKAASPAQQAQQEKMKACNAEAGKKDLKGEERKKFMSECLSAKQEAAPGQTQQEKMKTCNAEAGKKDLKGEERKKFMSECLKSEHK